MGIMENMERDKYHFCIMSGDVYPLPSANGVCILAIARELVNKGHKVSIICNGHHNRINAYNVDGIAFHIVKANYTAPYKYSFIQKLFRFIGFHVKLPIYPINDYFRIHHYIKVFRQINSSEKVDCLITCVLPVETICAGIKLMEKAGLQKVLIYQLDSVGNNRSVMGNGTFQNFKRKKAKSAELEYFNHASAIFELDCNEFYYSAEEFSKIQNKIIYVDIPLISEELYWNIRRLEEKLKTDATKIKFIYAGALDKDFRNPSYIIRQISKLNSQAEIQCECNFYTQADLHPYLNDISERDAMVFHNKGFVSQEELFTQYACSDFLISVGNKSTADIHEIPSKIFPYISTGKPIIHVIGGKHDACIPYLINYNNALLIDPEDKFEENYEKFRTFIFEHKGEIVDINDVLVKFERNTAGFSADAIINAV